MRAGIALGSNIGDRFRALILARTSILQLPSVSAPCLSSRLYETDPVDSDPNSGRFLNAVIEVEFSGRPDALLEGLQSIESAMGRALIRPKNAPRSIDLDVLYLGPLVSSDPRLTLPHPRIHLRRFVLTPLADIRPELLLPNQSVPVQELLAALDDPAGVDLAQSQWPDCALPS